jgi:hypothetical protein
LVLTVFSALSLVNRACCHHRGPRCLSILGLLDASVGASGPHGFAVRLAPFVTGAKASIASRAQRVVTTAIRPSDRVRDVRIDNAVSTRSRSELFLQQDWTTQISLKETLRIRVFGATTEMVAASWFETVLRTSSP